MKLVPFRGVNCSDAAGRQVAYQYIAQRLGLGKTSTGRRYEDYMGAPFYNYVDEASGAVHQVSGVRHSLLPDPSLLPYPCLLSVSNSFPYVTIDCLMLRSGTTTQTASRPSTSSPRRSGSEASGRTHVSAGGARPHLTDMRWQSGQQFRVLTGASAGASMDGWLWLLLPGPSWRLLGMLAGWLACWWMEQSMTWTVSEDRRQQHAMPRTHHSGPRQSKRVG